MSDLLHTKKLLSVSWEKAQELIDNGYNPQTEEYPVFTIHPVGMIRAELIEYDEYWKLKKAGIEESTIIKNMLFGNTYEVFRTNNNEWVMIIGDNPYRASLMLDYNESSKITAKANNFIERGLK